ncbi:MAG TPA: TIGR04290 family methyltransferase [Acidobacteriota bacterium]|nr:TIGR04290 family methyltransferase [Acidobacteriota bacterium]
MSPLESQLYEPKNSTEREIAQLGPWFHNLHLPDGTMTAPGHPLGDFPASKWKILAAHLPQDLTGWRTLDIGCNAGFYSFELTRRHADVLGIDSSARYLRQALWAAGKLGLENRVRFQQLQVYEIGRRAEKYDLILFMGIFYHLRYPLLALDAVRRRLDGLLVFQSPTVPEQEIQQIREDFDLDELPLLAQPGWPRLALIEKRMAGDPTNWWIPNTAAVEALLRCAGFRVIDRPGDDMWICETVPFQQETHDNDERQFRSAAGVRNKA